ncbi:MAG: ion channel [Acidobacteriota bacterium]
MTAFEPRPVPDQDPNLDLGFGSLVARESRKRLLNRDGTFNVRREGLEFWQSLSVYHYFLTISWPRFLSYVVATYVFLNALFAALYVAAGAHALTSFEGEPAALRFRDAFFFSVHTLATIGYGSIAPQNVAANVLVTIESLVGLLGFAVIAGIVFARFARPTAQIMFSDCALISPYRDKTAFMFRIVNLRSNQLVELEAKVMLARRKRDGLSAADREFLPLKLERDRVAFFPLAWTIVHPIDDFSPLRGMTEEMLRTSDAEFLILLNGFDETFSQNVHARSSYTGDEVVWGAKFKSMFNMRDEDGEMSIDIRKLHDFEIVPVH